MVTSLCVLFYAQESWLYARSENGHTVELTQVDLFSLSDWQHKTVSVNGFILGMTRAKASELAQARRLKLLPVSLSEGGRSCEASCALYQDGGNWIGMCTGIVTPSATHNYYQGRGSCRRVSRG